MFQESQSSTFWFQPVWGPHACVQPEVTILHLGGGISSHRRAQRCVSDCYVYPFTMNQDPAPSLHYCFLTAFPLFLYSLTSLITSCLNLPFGTQGRSRRLKPFSYKQAMGDTKRPWYLGGPYRVLLGFSLPISFPPPPPLPFYLYYSFYSFPCIKNKGILHGPIQDSPRNTF